MSEQDNKSPTLRGYEEIIKLKLYQMVINMADKMQDKEFSDNVGMDAAAWKDRREGRDNWLRLLSFADKQTRLDWVRDFRLFEAGAGGMLLQKSNKISISKEATKQKRCAEAFKLLKRYPKDDLVNFWLDIVCNFPIKNPKEFVHLSYGKFIKKCEDCMETVYTQSKSMEDNRTVFYIMVKLQNDGYRKERGNTKKEFKKKNGDHTLQDIKYGKKKKQKDENEKKGDDDNKKEEEYTIEGQKDKFGGFFPTVSDDLNMPIVNVNVSVSWGEANNANNNNNSNDNDVPNTKTEHEHSNLKNL